MSRIRLPFSDVFFFSFCLLLSSDRDSGRALVAEPKSNWRGGLGPSTNLELSQANLRDLLLILLTHASAKCLTDNHVLWECTTDNSVSSYFTVQSELP